MSKGFNRAIFGISAALVIFIFLGGFGLHGVRAGTQGNDGAYSEIGVYEEVLKKVQSDYVVEPNIGKVTDGALHGLLESLDPDSSYLSPAEYTQYKQRGDSDAKDSTIGVTGLNISKRYGYATVVSVMPGSPAEKQQITDGDIIEAIGGQSTREMSLALMRLLLEGKPGSNVTFALVRPRKAEPDNITLALVKASDDVAPFGEQQYESASILYLKPIVLTKSRVDEIENKLRGMQKNGNKKVLLDLRDVAQGDEAQAVRLANAFIESGTIATLEGQRFAKQTFTADKLKFVTPAPLAVLVNHGTAGAGELVAAAILDNKRGDVVGDRTFGEGAVQKTIDLPDGAALILSIAKYSSPSGKKIQDEAVTPNVVIGPSIDEQIAAETEEKPALPPADDQLNKALAILKAKNA